MKKTLSYLCVLCVLCVFVAPLSGVSAADLTVSWQDNSDNETGFRIERDDGAGFLPIAIAAENAEAYTDRNLDKGTVHTYRVVAINAWGAGIPSAPATGTTGSEPDAAGSVVVSGVSSIGRVDAISSRQMFDGTTLIVGFNVTGAPVRVVIRAVGPTLAKFGITGLADPKIQVVDGPANDDWGGDAALADAFLGLSLFALDPGSKDAALITTLDPGQHTVHITAPAGQTGEVLVEAYQLPDAP